jgi:transposase
MRYVFLPPYSPDYQPIEELFHTLKSWIRRHYVEGREAMQQDKYSAVNFLLEALDSITTDNVHGFFRDTSYDRFTV